MARIKLTAGRIREFTTDKAQAFLWDSEVPGLAVRATPSGKSAFVFQAKLNGKDIRVTVGDVNTWGIDKARAEARRLGSLIDQGTDPRQEKQERIAAGEAKRDEARRRDVIVRDAWAVYVAARRHKWSPRHLEDHETMARGPDVARKRGTGCLKAGPLAPLMPLKLKDLTPAKLAAWLEAETQDRPTWAALAYRLLRAFLRWCEGHDDYAAAVHVGVASSRAVKDHVPSAKTKEGDSLQREQLRPWFEAMRKIPVPAVSAYLQSLLLTGARREELARLRWADVDFQWKSMKIADKVEESGRVIPLTPYVAALLRDLKIRNETPPQEPKRLRPKAGDKQEAAPAWKPSPWIFSSAARNTTTGRVADVWQQHATALQMAGLPHVSLHGLRRSFGTLAEWVECPVGVVAQIQGHKPSAIAEKHYRRRPLDLLRMWHIRIESWMLEQAGIPQPEEGQEGLRLVKS
jgi:integrase